MIGFTIEQWVILFLVFVLGWVLGLMSRSGAAHWRRELEAERAAHAETRRQHDARIAAANERITELERRTPATGLSGGAIGAAARGTRDDLTAIRGIDAQEELRLNEAGYHSYRDIEKMSDSDEAALEGRLGYEPGHIAREGWREQAAELRKTR